MKFFLLLFLCLGCAHQGVTEQDIAEADSKELMRLWERSLKYQSEQTSHARLGEHTLEQIYLSSFDEADFFEHFMKLNIAGQLNSKEAHLELSNDLLKLKARLENEKTNPKSAHISVLLSALALKVQESSDKKFGK